MRSFRNISRYVALLAALVSIVTMLFAVTDFIYIAKRWLVLTLSVIFGVLISAFLSFFLRTLNKNPAPLRVAVIGPPGSGKTVYLTVLFHELQVVDRGKIVFQPYGRETIEKVTSNLNLLASQTWLPATTDKTVFPFRANVRFMGGILPTRYTVEIGDYAGEHMEEFDSSSEQWLHRTDYFKYVAQSDVVFMVVDAGRIITSETPDIDHAQNNLIAALQVLIEERGVPVGRPFSVPVALLVLKSDLLATSNKTDDDVIIMLTRLIRICESRCRFFRVFFVSSVGELDEGGKPPRSIKPVNVVPPMLWALSKIDV